MEKKVAFVVSWVPLGKFPLVSEVYVSSSENEAEKIYKMVAKSDVSFSAALREVHYF